MTTDIILPRTSPSAGGGRTRLQPPARVLDYIYVTDAHRHLMGMYLCGPHFM